ncbi:sodium/calcium exchanger Calx isoform X2 [Halyomorpha halys]|uniref:sodium/calcium exchanger Calx isoform X2 n=1 Tax=Halyomorpha halys TaxID=286706 RepID=UPI0034D19E78
MDESSWNPYIRVTVYFLGLGYSFFGVAIVMDIFMSSIEYIISKRKKIYSLRPDLAERLHIRIWNDVVGNLTLLCLGTSAPEVFLSIIEVVGHNFEAGYIGPASIVGSAAVNLIIIALCNIALDVGEVKVVNEYGVFCFTGIFSVFAFFWIYVILEISSRGVVELWEASLTLAFYPILVVGAYVLNMKVRLNAPFINYWRGDEGEKEIAEATFFKDGVLDKQSLLWFLKEVTNYPGITMAEAAILAAAKMGGVRALSSGRPLKQRLNKHLKEVLKIAMDAKLEKDSSVIYLRLSTPDQMSAIVDFAAATVAVTENVGTFPVYLDRRGYLNSAVVVRVQSMDGRAKHGEDYVQVNERIQFEKKQTSAEVKVRIINERKYEPTEEFFLRLTPAYSQDQNVKIGTLSIMEIKIIHDESPGVIQFEKRGHVVNEAVGLLTLILERFHGSDGEVRVSWRTVDDTARSGVDYEGDEDSVTFQHGEVRRFIKIRIINTMTEEKDVRFNVDLYNPVDGAVLGDNWRTTVIITDDDNIWDYIDKVMTLTSWKLEHLSRQSETWCKQIKEAMMVNGGVEPVTNMDFFLHFLCFFWKVVFSLIPPPGLLGGWLQFFTALVLIGVMATLIGDMAAIFGCVAGMGDTLTALLLVGLGTSLPDLFACLIAMRQSKTADEAIGNINGTCSVNVFVGLGLPWTLAAVHHLRKGDYFEIPPEGFAGVVVLFSICCLITFILLVVRRNCKCCGYAEVGGSKMARYVTATAFILLYAVFITLATFDINGYITI